MKLTDWAKAQFSHFKEWLAGEWKELEPKLVADLEDAEKALIPVARDLVMGLILAKMSGADKFSTASNQLIEQAGHQGLTIAVSLANKIVQDAVTGMQLAQGASLVVKTDEATPEQIAAVQAATLKPL